MSHREFNDLLNSLNGLSLKQLAALRRALDGKPEPSRQARAKKTPRPDEGTVFDVLQRAGLIGCLKGSPGTPSDLASNPNHMEGFGNG